MPALTKAGLKKLKGRVFSAEQFERIVESIFENGFVNTNGSLNQLADYIGYKAYLQVEEFADAEGHKVVLEFVKEFVNGHVYYHVRDVEVE